jgi:hypothetical protein
MEGGLHPAKTLLLEYAYSVNVIPPMIAPNK